MRELEYRSLKAISNSQLVRFEEAPIKALIPDGDTRDSKSKRLGRLIHKALLEPTEFRELSIVQPDFGPMQSSKNRQARDEWVQSLPSGSIVLTNDELSFVNLAVSQAVEKKLSGPMAERFGATRVGDLLSGCFTESAQIWKMNDGGAEDHLCKALLDAWCPNRRFVLDVKTSASARPSAFARSIWDYSYDCQAAWYLEAAMRNTGEAFDDFIWLVIETDDPVVVDGIPQVGIAVYTPDEKMLLNGHKRVMDRFSRFIRWCESREYDFYPDAISTISYPAFVKEME